jgi:hypothetical protein
LGHFLSATTGAPLDASGVQLPGVLDALFAYNGPLGAHVSDDAVTLTLWAPTAQVIPLNWPLLEI